MFLATTALKEFWDHAAERTLLLGPWCIRFPETHEHMDMLPDPWETLTAKNAAILYLDDIYHLLLPQLANTLNLIHLTTYSTRYWEIICGSYLRIYLNVMYDRYTTLKNALLLHPNLYTIGLDPSHFSVPRTGDDFVTDAANDLFNLQLYTDLARYLNIPITTRLPSTTQRVSETKTLTIKDKIRQLAHHFFLTFGGSNKTIIAESGISFRTLLYLFIKSKGKVVPLTYFSETKNHYALNEKARCQLSDISLSANQDLFVTCAIHFLGKYFPIAYVEAYADFAKNARALVKPNIIFSAMGWHYKEPFKFFAAEAQEVGTQLVGHQHGGDYGILAYHLSEQHERAVTDKFYSWGWQMRCDKQVNPFYSFKLRYLPKGLAQSKKQRHYILYGSANTPRYLFRFSYPISSMLKFFAWQKIFIEHLDKAVADRLYVRLHHIDWDWDQKARLTSHFPHLKFSSANRSFIKALGASDLYIADHIGTTFAESFATNKPTILCYDPTMWVIRDSAEPYFAALKEVGVVYHSPIEGARALNNIGIDAIYDWWFEPARQKVIQDFCKNYCRRASFSLTEWVSLLTQGKQHVKKGIGKL